MRRMWPPFGPFNIPKEKLKSTATERGRLDVAVQDSRLSQLISPCPVPSPPSPAFWRGTMGKGEKKEKKGPVVKEMRLRNLEPGSVLSHFKKAKCKGY